MEVTKITLLDSATERELWTQYKNHEDLASRHCLIEHYQPLVVKALSYWRANEPILMDLVQEGLIGLIEAVENYEPERGVAFSLYAMHRIRGRMLNFFAKEAKASQVSLDTPVLSEEETPLLEMLADSSLPVTEVVERKFILDQMHAAMGRLPNKERLALSGVYIEEQEPRQVASTLQITPSHLSRLQKQGIRRVRGMLSRLMNEMKK